MTSATKSAYSADAALWRNLRFLEFVAQAAFVLLLALLGWFLYNNVATRLAAAGSGFSWRFLGTVAGFQVGEGLAFSPQESYGRAFVVALVNTLRVAGLGIVLTTVLGLFAGIARLSTNWLVRNIAAVYIEIIQSTPLLVQLFFWYFGVILALPNIEAAQEVAGLAYVSNRGINLATLRLSAVGAPWLWWVGAGVVLGIAAGWLRRRSLDAQGRVGSGLDAGLLTLLAVAVAGYLFIAFAGRLPGATAYELASGDRGRLFVDANGNATWDDGERPIAYTPVTLLDAGGAELATTATNAAGQFRFFGLPDGATGTALRWDAPAPIVLDRPTKQGFNFIGGTSLTPEFAGLLLGLVIYTGAFVAEIVRAGINAVPKGQWEASRALGLRPAAILRMIVLPQALRVIIPPLTNQYLNLTKNSSLAIAIGFPDMFNVSLTILNQTGAEVEMFLLIMVTYQAFSLLTSTIMNWYNRQLALSEQR
jgi:general L-amino acid transport system permease protein